MKLLITGTTGFIGRNLKEYFQATPHDIQTPKRDELDLLDPRTVETYIEKNAFDAIIHCGVTLNSVEENLKMYFNLERCSNSFGRMICIGSGAEYDPKNYIPMMKEGYFEKHIPSDIYSFSKYVIAKDIENKKRNIFNLRVFGIYGKYEDYNRRFISNNICRALANQNISMNKNMLFDYLFIDDFSKIVEIFLGKEPIQKSYNICTSIPIDLYTLASIIKEVDGNKQSIIVKQEGMNTEYSGDNSLFLQEFGAFEFIDHKKSISALYDWYKNSSNIVFDELHFN